ncbi:MAG: DUF1302 family protein [Syntrophobacteraceae bacterium]
MRRILISIVAAIVIGIFLSPMDSFAVSADIAGLSVESHGHLQSNFVIRDGNGFNYGFMDHLEGVQWLQEIQADFEVKPKYVGTKPCLRFEKAFFRWRGSYDAIYDLRSSGPGTINDIRGQRGPSRFDLDKDDLKFENDMREMFVDFVYEPPDSEFRGNLRLGRQIVTWGESDGFNLMNIVCPNDYHKMMFFSPPEDLLTPLYMGRLDLKTGPYGPFSEFNAQFLVIPDNRPVQYSALDGRYNAPYASIFKPWTGPFGADVRYVAPADTFGNMNYGVRLGTVVQETTAFLYYYDGYLKSGMEDYPIADWRNFYNSDDPHIDWIMPRTRVYGYSFVRHIPWGDWVFRGEGSLTQDQCVINQTLWAEWLGGRDPFTLTLREWQGIGEHDQWQFLFGFDKTWSNVHLGTTSALISAFQVYFCHLSGFEENEPFTNIPQDDVKLTLLLMTDYWHGKITPQIFLMYDTIGAWMTTCGVNYTINNHWYANITQMSFWRGHAEGRGDFAPKAPWASEINFKIGFQW